jgi:predicted CXXCH cytochrome family protein
MGVLLRPLMRFGFRSLICLPLLWATASNRLPAANSDAFLGRDVCAGCHKNLSASQSHTAMARTWQMPDTRKLPSPYAEDKREGPDPSVQYRVHRDARGFRYEVQLPGHPVTSMRVEALVGGDRHGLSFLLRVPGIEGASLPRSPLVEGRFLHYAPGNHLALSPGFPAEKPTTFETALGRVLSPQFETKCVTCHGKPRVHGSAVERGVSCENCHGAGREHLVAIARKSADKAIQNPARLPVAQRMQPCAQCHSGFSVVEDPLPSDLLISDQVTSLKNSECWRQSGGNITCTGCHDPHRDAPRALLVARSEKKCLECHDPGATAHAGLCPVNRSSGCIGCHMPDQIKPPLTVADHWIRVHPEQHVVADKHLPEWRSRLVPKHLYLRIIAVGTADKANELKSELDSGGSFFELARANSQDASSAKNGGFLGDLDVDQLDQPWARAAVSLQPGEISTIVAGGGEYFIVGRMPRNFREDAEAVFNRAMALRKEGNAEQSANELLNALKIYPRLLRGLTYLGITYSEAGNAQAGASILALAARLYPQDPGAHLNLGISLEALNRTADAIAEYKKALDIQPDLESVYLNLGAALYANGQQQEAIKAYRAAINVNPLMASLHYSLGIVLQHEGESAEAAKEISLATKINPEIGKQSGGK